MSETMKKKKRFYEVLNDRFGFEALNYEVPSHANTILYTLGGITLVSVLITIASGIILALWYVPTPEEANASIRVITEEVFLGSVIRGAHFWGAQLTIIAIVLHLLRVLYYGSYKRPREGNWIVGVLLFAVMIGLYFTGTTLKWDQEGNEALEHAQVIAETLGFGAFFNEEFIPVILRFFIMHVSLLPLALLALVFIHMLLIKRLKISPLPWGKANTATVGHKQHTFFHHIRSLVGYGYLTLGVILILAILAPPAIGPDPISGIEVTKPVWPFLWLYSVEEWFGVNGAWIAGGLTIIGLLAVPFIDRAKEQALPKRKLILTLLTIVVVTLIVLTIYAYFSTPVVHLDM